MHPQILYLKGKQMKKSDIHKSKLRGCMAELTEGLNEDVLVQEVACARKLCKQMVGIHAFR